MVHAYGLFIVRLLYYISKFGITAYQEKADLQHIQGIPGLVPSSRKTVEEKFQHTLIHQVFNCM